MRYVLADFGKFRISVTIERAPADTAKECREIYWKRIKRFYKNGTVRRFTLGDAAGLECYIRTYQGMDVKQKKFNLFYVKDGYWIDVHLSRTLFQKENQKEMFSILKSVKIKSGYKSSTAENLYYGHVFFVRKLYAEAIPFYEKGLVDGNRLKRIVWIISTDNLGLSYGITGKHEKARKLFESALKQMPEYPSFHYNLACYYGEKKQYAKAIKYLKLAFQYKNNLLRGARMPDPESDSSFRYFRDKKEFKQLVRTLRGRNADLE